MSLRSSSPVSEAPETLRRKSSGFLESWLSSQSRKTPSSPYVASSQPPSSPGPSHIEEGSSSSSPDASTSQPPAKRIKITADNGWTALQKPRKSEGVKKTKPEPVEKEDLKENDTLTANRRKSTVVVKKLSAKAKLAALPELPLDILLEIFGHLHPVDLLHLARTTKSLRGLLMRKMTVGVWQASLETVPDLPPCPDDMSHPAYANLMFDSHCHNCLAKNVKNISFLLRVRYCTRCVKEKLSPCNEYNQPTKHNALIKRAVAFAPFGPISLTHCSIEERDRFIREINAMTEGRLEFAEAKIAKLKVRKSHAKKCHSWLGKQTTARDKELRRTRRERTKAIEQKLIALGYASELEFLQEYREYKTYVFPRPALVEFKEHPSVKQNKPLTERVWANIEPIMVEYMDHARQKRLENDAESFMETWRTTLSEAYHMWRTSIKTLQKYPAGAAVPIPSLGDFLTMHDVLDIYQLKEIQWEWRSLDISARSPSPARQQSIMKRKLDLVNTFLETRMDKKIPEWQVQRLRALYFRFHEKQPSFTINDIFLPTGYGLSYDWRRTEELLLKRFTKVMGLAIMVFRCTNHIAHSHFEELWADAEGLWLKSGGTDYERYKTTMYSMREERNLLWFPEVLHHPCPGQLACGWEEQRSDAFPYLMVDPDSKYLRRVPWDDEKLEFDEQASKIVKSVIEAYGGELDWRKVSAVDLDQRDDRFACLKCSFGEKCDGERAVKVYNWREAVMHNIIAHFGDGLTTFELLSPEDAQKARDIQRAMVEALTRPPPLSNSVAQTVPATTTNATTVPPAASSSTPAIFTHVASASATTSIPAIMQTPDGPRARITTVYGTDKQRLYLPQAEHKLYKCAACLDRPGVAYNRRMTRPMLQKHLEANSGCGNHVDLDYVDPVWTWDDERGVNDTVDEGEGGEEVEYHLGFTSGDDVPDDDSVLPKWRPVKGIHYYEAVERGPGRPLPIVKMVPQKRVEGGD